MKPKILIIDDNQSFIEELTLLLIEDFKLLSSTNPTDGLKIIVDHNPELVLLDLMLGPGVSGLDILNKIHDIDPSLPVLIITEHGSIDTAVKAISQGAVNYVSKTPNMKELIVYINKALNQRSLLLQSRSLAEETAKNFHTIVGKSTATHKLLQLIKLVSENDNIVLITGESGTGKELVARQIHQRSSRRNQVFLSINCAAIPRELLESELFGHEKGAFTGATGRKLGKFEVASNGILFFDEISELNLESQVKLLRVIQEKEFTRLGSHTSIKTGTRILAATNGNLEDLMQKGQFREDLFYRLDVLRIKVPSLRERLDDIPLLVNHFIQTTCLDMKIFEKTPSKQYIKALMDHNWPGNIRELRNYVTRSIMLTRGKIIDESILEVSPLINEDKLHTSIHKTPETWEEMVELRKSAADHASRQVEKDFLKQLLITCDGNVSEAARKTGLNRTNLHKMIARCGVKI